MRRFSPTRFVPSVFFPDIQAGGRAGFFPPYASRNIFFAAFDWIKKRSRGSIFFPARVDRQQRSRTRVYPQSPHCGRRCGQDRCMSSCFFSSNAFSQNIKGHFIGYKKKNNEHININIMKSNTIGFIPKIIVLLLCSNFFVSSDDFR